ncbi:MAG: ROK family protein, partial [Planctomycetota bacterium]
EIAPGFAIALGLEISNRGVIAGAVDLGGEVLSGSKREPGEATAAAILGAAREALAEALAGADGGTLAGIGVGVAGVMSSERGVSREFPNVPDWRDVDVSRELRVPDGIEVDVDNDVRAATLAEFRYGAGRDLSDFIYLHIGRGIAAGAVLGGRLHTGAFRGAGELGHFQVKPDGPVCYCGSTGCLASVASPRALLGQAAEAVRQGVKTSLSAAGAEDAELDAAGLFAAAAAGDRLARNLVEGAGASIGRITAGLDNVLDPQAFVLGGLLAGEAEVLSASIESNHRAIVMPLLEGTTEFRRGRLGENAAVIGAATLVFERLFEEAARLLRVPEGRRGGTGR